MSEQPNAYISLQRKQFTLLVITLVITMIAGIVFAAVFINSLVQGQVASALALQDKQKSHTVTPVALPATSATYTHSSEPTRESSISTCVSPPEAPSQPQSHYKHSYKKADHPKIKSTYHPKHYRNEHKPKKDWPKFHPNVSKNSYVYNNDYRKTENIKTTTHNGTIYKDSFNQGSYNKVEGDLTQTNSNNNSTVYESKHGSKYSHPINDKKKHGDNHDKDRGQKDWIKDSKPYSVHPNSSYRQPEFAL